MKDLEAQRERRAKKHKKATAKQKEPRASTTDAEARVMKMADGGYRPAYNGQFASDPQTQVIVAVDLDTTGSDGGLMRPMQEKIVATYGQVPRQYLVDGGFHKIEISRARCGRHRGCPAAEQQAQDGPSPRAEDGQDGSLAAAMAATRARRHRERAKHECINADLRTRGGPRLRSRPRGGSRGAGLPSRTICCAPWLCAAAQAAALVSCAEARTPKPPQQSSFDARTTDIRPIPAASPIHPHPPRPCSQPRCGRAIRPWSSSAPDH
jgi:hypothetical protein